MPKLTYEKVKEALILHNGIVLYAAKACGVARYTLYKFMDAHPDLKEIRANATEELIDIAENRVLEAIEKGELKTVRWYLERLGKDRGYVTRSETTGKDGAPLEIGEITRTVVAPAKK